MPLFQVPWLPCQLYLGMRNPTKDSSQPQGSLLRITHPSLLMVPPEIRDSLPHHLRLLVVYIPSVKPEFLTSPVWFFGPPDFLNPIPWDTSAGLPFRWFNLVVPLKELSSKIFETHYERRSTNQKTSPKTWGKSSTNLCDFTWVPKSNCRVKTGFNEFFSWRPLWKVGRNCN